jgi:acetyl-CoA acetyltransferase
MQFENVYIPYGCYWSSPFSKWQGSYANLEPIPFAAEVAVRALKERDLPPSVFDGCCLGWTVPSKHSFYGGPWVAGLIGLTEVPAPILSQACATGVRCIIYSSHEVQSKSGDTFLAVTADKCSNGPHTYYPRPDGQGGTGVAEDWVMDNFGYDPFAHKPMFVTAENVAKEAGIDRKIQEEVTLMRYEAYQNQLKDNRAFQKRYMVTPLEVKDRRGRKVITTVETDEGIFPTTAEGLAKLKPVMEGGTVTFGTQTFPADGNAGMVVTTREKAKQYSKDSNIEIQVIAHAQARVKKAHMPAANAPAVRCVMERAGIGPKDIKAVTSHTPFAVNDVHLSKEIGFDLKEMNRYSCSLIWGHPQGPTGMRGVIELIEELAILGGGYGLFTGCAAGDSAASMIIKVSVS